jgi:hypothetical protein
MTVVCEHEGIREHPVVRVEKYSTDQTAFAECQLVEELSWGRRVLVKRLGIWVPRLHGDWLRQLFPAGPEDGYAGDEGNLMVATGLASMLQLLTNVAQSNTVRGLVNTQTAIGVGSTATAASAADSHLGADGVTPNGTVGAYYQQADALYPAWAGSGVANGGQLNGQCTYAAGLANMAWNEWCWAVGNSVPAAGSTLSGVFTNGFMFNHKVPAASLGTKAAGAAWVFTQTLTWS